MGTNKIKAKRKIRSFQFDFIDLTLGESFTRYFPYKIIFWDSNAIAKSSNEIDKRHEHSNNNK